MDCRKIIIGTANFGMKYGLGNKNLNQKEIVYLRQTTGNMDETNTNLQQRLNRYLHDLRHLQSQNKRLQKENDRKEQIIERLLAKQERKEQIHKNQISVLHKKMELIQTENGQLKEEIQKIAESAQQTGGHSKHLSLTSMSPPSTVRDIERLQMLRTIEINLQDIEQSIPDNVQETVSSVDSQDMMNESDIIDQLLRFEYKQSDIQMAMKMVVDKQDINKIVEFIENNLRQQNQVNDLEKKLNELHKMHDEAKREMTKFKKKCKELRRQNERLKVHRAIAKSITDTDCSYNVWKYIPFSAR